MHARCVRLLIVVVTACLAACATPTSPGLPLDEWHDVALPGKDRTQYSWGVKEGRPAIEAVSERSASMWRRHVSKHAPAVGDVSFSWWVQDLVVGGNVAIAARADAPARVMFAFAGDHTSLPPRTRALFDLAEAITGERPPYATLIYVWDATAPVGTVIINPRSDRIRKIVVDSGPQELRRWRDHSRNLAADFRLAFGEAPGQLAAVAIMTDSDNTGGSARSWYGPVQLH